MNRAGSAGVSAIETLKGRHSRPYATYSESVIQVGDSVVVIGKVTGENDLKIERGRFLVVSQTGTLGARKAFDQAEMWVTIWVATCILYLLFIFALWLF